VREVVLVSVALTRAVQSLVDMFEETHQTVTLGLS